MSDCELEHVEGYDYCPTCRRCIDHDDHDAIKTIENGQTFEMTCRCGAQLVVTRRDVFALVARVKALK